MELSSIQVSKKALENLALNDVLNSDAPPWSSHKPL